MCGYSITFEKPRFEIVHRGYVSTHQLYQQYNINFYSLPLSSHNLGLSQPLIDRKGILLFNGEIFNYKELDKTAKSDLHYLNNLFKKSNNNLDLIIKEAVLWDGFYSITFIKEDGDCLFFTDPLGKKQIYYSKKGIASEIKPIIVDNILFDYNEKDFGTFNTNFNNVYRAKPGILYKYEQITRSASSTNVKIEIRGEKIDLYSMIEKSVQQRVINSLGDVSLLLSSGLDSNIILHHLIKMGYKDRVELVTLNHDEKKDVEKIAEYYRMDLKVVNIPNKINWEDIFYYYENSLDYGSLIPNYYLFKECKNKTILTGDGADEFFGGYNRAKISDTFNYDVYKELPYYHNIRIDRMSMRWTKEARNPLMSFNILKGLPYFKMGDLVGKKALIDIYKEPLSKIININNKKPLRITNKEEHSKIAKEQFFNFWNKQLKNI